MYSIVLIAYRFINLLLQEWNCQEHLQNWNQCGRSLQAGSAYSSETGRHLDTEPLHYAAWLGATRLPSRTPIHMHVTLYIYIYIHYIHIRCIYTYISLTLEIQVICFWRGLPKGVPRYRGTSRRCYPIVCIIFTDAIDPWNSPVHRGDKTNTRTLKDSLG